MVNVRERYIPPRCREHGGFGVVRQDVVIRIVHVCLWTGRGGWGFLLTRHGEGSSSLAGLLKGEVNLAVRMPILLCVVRRTASTCIVALRYPRHHVQLDTVESRVHDVLPLRCHAMAAAPRTRSTPK